MDNTDTELERPRNVRVACQKCHARKIKCTGGIPCNNCRQSSAPEECKYPSRSRRIRVEQKYIDDLLNEIRRLRQIAQAPQFTTHPIEPAARNTNSCVAREDEFGATAGPLAISDNTSMNATPATESNRTRPLEITEGVRNPLVDDRPWFFNLTPEMPSLVGEASDAAFATRIRQELLGETQSHYPRTQTVADQTLYAQWNAEIPWPTPSRARFLIKVAFSTVCRRYYLTRKSATIALLEQRITNPSQCDMLSVCKLHALFALGEIYSTRTCDPGNEFPGIAYYATATWILRVFSEQPRIDCVEIMLALSIYSLAMNRRHAAYCIVGCAMRFGIIMGLHLTVPHDQLPNRELQEHRVRIWWTLYILDRSWAFMLGKPVSIQDEDINVGLPSDFHLSAQSAADDFADTDCLNAGICLSRLGARITASTYSRRPQETTFSDRVQQMLQDLDRWLQELPSNLRTCMGQMPTNAPMPTVTLYLYFNQCYILTLRPVLLYTLRIRRISPCPPQGGARSLSRETALALSGACRQYARRSFHVLTECWIDGSFPTYDYNYSQYLFSASLILAISSLSNAPGTMTDGDDFETAVDILRQLQKTGNYAAKEFYRHVESIKAILEQISLEESQTGQAHWARDTAIDVDSREMQTDSAPPGLLEGIQLSQLDEHPLGSLLTYSHLDLGILDTAIINEGFQAFMWPDEDYIALGEAEI